MYHVVMLPSEKPPMAYMESNLETKMIQMELFIKQKQTYRY